jgi:hypothetical protein
MMVGHERMSKSKAVQQPVKMRFRKNRPGIFAGPRIRKAFVHGKG